MKKRLIIYFNYHPNGQADAACRFAVQQMAAVGQVFFVNNGPLQPESRQWAQGCCHTVLERENTGFDVGAYRDAVLQTGLDMLLQYDEVVLMNYTLAGPVGDVAAMFAAMDGRPELDFWGLTRHYAMRSHRFGGAKAMVPEHIQSHFVVVRSRMMADFFAYWQAAALPASYEDSVRLHETQFTAHFAALGYRWDTFVDTKDLASLFVNPIMACPKLLLADRGCPFFKRRSFFTPYADELRRTDGQAAAELYDYLKSETDYPVDGLLRALLPVQPLAAMAQNLHWHYILPQTAGECAPILLDANTLAKGCALQPDAVYCLPLPRAAGVEGYYYARSMPTSLQLAQAAELFDAHPLVGVLGPALPLYAGCAAEKPGAGSSRNLPYRQNCLRWIARSLWMKPRRRCPMAAVCWCGGRHSRRGCRRCKRSRISGWCRCWPSITAMPALHLKPPPSVRPAPMCWMPPLLPSAALAQYSA